ncbi:Carbamoylphosphate synthase large subunit [Brevibacillus sp. IT-7CA2]|uniref:ATP-grasp domain-containing protein n=1 Tax=Brevibacillus sp. IT-7CA2 TaxID=3026436 RepID=UPI0039DF92BB
MNILVTSVGRRVKLLHYFVREWGDTGKIIAVDCDPTAPALYAAHHHEQVPRIDDPGYLDALLQICQRYEIKAILSLIDPELTLLAAHADRFYMQGIEVIVSSLDVIQMCLDKRATYDFLSAHQIPAIPTFTKMDEVQAALSAGQITYPLIVKPRYGSASLGITRVENDQEWSVLMEKTEDVVVQPFLQAEEYGVDGYVDLISGELVTLFTRKKLRMRAGETDRSLAVKDPRLLSLAKELIRVLEPRGPIDIDCFLVGDQYVVSEINPRFGGGYPHAHESGANSVRALLQNIKGLVNVAKIGEYKEGSIMMKYDEVILLE